MSVHNVFPDTGTNRQSNNMHGNCPMSGQALCLSTKQPKCLQCVHNWTMFVYGNYALGLLARLHIQSHNQMCMVFLVFSCVLKVCAM